jgi:hypothetical protein
MQDERESKMSCSVWIVAKAAADIKYDSDHPSAAAERGVTTLWHQVHGSFYDVSEEKSAAGRSLARHYDCENSDRTLLRTPYSRGDERI